MLGAAKIYFVIYGLLTIVGGVIGYVSKGSKPSIIAGTVSGLLLLVSAYLLPQKQTVGLIIALVISLLLAAQFVPKLLHGGKMMPAGLMSILSVLGIIVVIAAWLRK